MVTGNELVELSLRRNGTLERQSAVFALSRLVNLESVAEPLIGGAGGDELDSAEGVAVRKKKRQSCSSARRGRKKERDGKDARDVLKRVAKAVREVVCRVDAPLRARSVMRLAQCSVRNDVPHRRVARLHVLLHPQRHLSRRVLALLHRGKLGERLLDRLGAVL